MLKSKSNVIDSKNNSAEGIDYKIRTMDSDLNNEKDLSLTFKLQEEEKLAKRKQKEIPQKKIEKKIEKKISNPFLEDLTSDETPQSFETLSEALKKPSSKKEMPKTNREAIAPLLQQTRPISKKHPSSLKKIKRENFPKKPTKVNSSLLIVLFLILLISSGSGFYYFYSLKKPEVLVLPEPPIKTAPVEVVINKIDSYEDLDLSKQSLLELIMENKETLAEDSGLYYKINRASSPIATPELLSLLNVTLPGELSTQLNNPLVLNYKQQGILKIGLIFKTDKAPLELVGLLNEQETLLPEMLKGLFIDEEFILENQPILFQDSALLKGIRFHNLVPGDESKSIDWGIINDEYVIFTTSKNSTSRVINDISTKTKTLTENNTEMSQPND